MALAGFLQQLGHRKVAVLATLATLAIIFVSLHKSGINRRLGASADPAGSAAAAGSSLVADDSEARLRELLAEPQHDTSGYSVQLKCPDFGGRKTDGSVESHNQHWFGFRRCCDRAVSLMDCVQVRHD